MKFSAQFLGLLLPLALDMFQVAVDARSISYQYGKSSESALNQRGARLTRRAAVWGTSFENGNNPSIDTLATLRRRAYRRRVLRKRSGHGATEEDPLVVRLLGRLNTHMQTQSGHTEAQYLQWWEQ